MGSHQPRSLRHAETPGWLAGDTLGLANRAGRGDAREHSQIAIMADYAANAFRTASDSICSAAGVNRERLTSPMRLKVRRATGSHKSVETPSANIAMARCS
jgi:hypothetical protein